MARYPTFEEYQQRGNYKDGIKRCDDFLKKNPNDVQLLTLKLQLLTATKADGTAVLNQLLAIQPPIRDLRELVAIEEAVISSQNDEFPQPKTAGPEMAKLWDNALKAFNAPNHKLDVLSVRFSRAVVANRMADAQQALIQLKAMQPKNRVIYMAHAAVTQLLSTSKEDLQSRLALSLARKAVTERFDEDGSLDCRVPGQIFAFQESTKDIESIADRPFKESKQVYDALNKINRSQANGKPSPGQTEDSLKASPNEWLRSEVQKLKEQFSQLISSSAQSTAILEFAANAIRLFHTAKTSVTDDRSRGKVDACFLSISGLVRAFEQTDKPCYLLHSTYLAETLLKEDPHIHEARMILVYLYMRLGLGSLALRMFDSLRVKEIQNDTVGHAIYARLSFTHPHSTALNKKESIDPLKKASQALKVYTRCEEKLAETQAGALNHAQTGMILDLQEVRDNLRSSLSRRIVHLEQRRLDRLVHGQKGEPTDELGPKVTANWLQTTDNRDFSATFNYTYNVEKLLHGASASSKEWLLYTLAADTAWCLATSSPTPINDPQTLISELQTAHLDISRLQLHDQSVSATVMTRAEYLAADLACQVLKILAKSDAKFAPEEVEAVRKAVDNLGVEALVAARDVLAERLRDHYVFVDVLRIVVKTCGLALKRTTGVDEGWKGLQDLAKGHVSTLQSHAREQAREVNVAGLKTVMGEDASIEEALAAFGSDGLAASGESVVASAREGWEGLGKISVE